MLYCRYVFETMEELQKRIPAHRSVAWDGDFCRQPDADRMVFYRNIVLVLHEFIIRYFPCGTQTGAWV